MAAKRRETIVQQRINESESDLTSANGASSSDLTITRNNSSIHYSVASDLGGDRFEFLKLSATDFPDVCVECDTCMGLIKQWLTSKTQSQIKDVYIAN